MNSVVVGIMTGNDVVEEGAAAVELTSLPFWGGDPSRFWETLLSGERGQRLETYLNRD